MHWFINRYIVSVTLNHSKLLANLLDKCKETVSETWIQTDMITMGKNTTQIG